MAYLSVCHQAFLQLKCTEGRKEVDNLNDINRVNEALDLSLDLDIAGGGHASCCPCHSLLCVCMQTTSLGVPFFVSQERPSLRATQAQTQQEQQSPTGLATSGSSSQPIKASAEERPSSHHGLALTSPFYKRELPH